MGAATWLPALGEAPGVRAACDATREFLDVPARPGVVVLRGAGADERAVLIATTGDARDFARRKLGSGEAGAGPRADLKSVVGGMDFFPAGSPLEAEAVYLHQARVHMPATHSTVSERWRVWFLHVDPGAEFPQWTKTNLAKAGSVAARSASTAATGSGVWSGGRLIGPLPDKDTAGRVIEQVIDAFDLCRFYNLLVLAPKAAACAYKEMGRCAAPCDGTEPMDGYRGRTLEAAEVVCGMRGGAQAMAERLGAQVREAAGRMEFERAGALQNQLRRVEALMKPALSHLSELAKWRVVFVVPHAEPGLARLALLAGPQLGALGELRVKGASAGEAEEAAARAIALSAEPEKPDGSSTQADAVSVAARWLFLAGAKKKGRAIRIEEGASAAELGAEMMKAAAGLSRPAKNAAMPEQQVDVLN